MRCDYLIFIFELLQGTDTKLILTTLVGAHSLADLFLSSCVFLSSIFFLINSTNKVGADRVCFTDAFHVVFQADALLYSFSHMSRPSMHHYYITFILPINRTTLPERHMNYQETGNLIPLTARVDFSN